MAQHDWALGAGLIIVGAALLVWLLVFTGLRHLTGVTAALLVVLSLALLLVGVGFLGGRRLLGPVLLAVGVLGCFLAAVPDEEGVEAFRASLGAVSGGLFVAGAIVTCTSLARRRTLRRKGVGSRSG